MRFVPDFLCMLREAEFSPGKVREDAAILLAVAGVLRERGYLVDIAQPSARRWPAVARSTVVLSMAQGEQALARLAEWEAQGIRVLNRVQAVRNCYRAATLALWRHHRVPHPPSELVPATGASLPEWWLGSGAWLKRADVHSMAEGDVCFVRSLPEAERALRSLHQRGVAEAVLQQHVPGTVIKFYGVGEQFFHTVGPRLGAEVQRRLAAQARAAAQALVVEVFGGDCVISPEGECLLIDLNDWPSYAACRLAAATSIAAYAQAEKARGS